MYLLKKIKRKLERIIDIFFYFVIVRITNIFIFKGNKSLNRQEK